MLLHFQLQELKTEALSGSVLIALQPYLGSWNCVIQWHFQILRIDLHDVVTYHSHSQPFVLWDSVAARPLGHAGVAAQAVRRDEGRAGLGQTLECDDTQLLLAEFKRLGWASLPLGYHTYTAFLVPVTCPLSAPVKGCLLPGTPGSLCLGCADGEEHSLQAKMPHSKNDPSGEDVCIFTLSLFPIKSHCSKGGNNAVH